MVYAAFLLGLLGSMHCLGMCGPIAFALPVRSTNIWVKFFKYLIYNAGRVFTYAMLGLFIGVVGRGFAIAGLQKTLSIVTGLLMLLSVVLIYLPFKHNVLAGFTNTIKEKLKSAFQFYFKQKGITALFVLGVLNGLLPCGMVYIAMLGALATGDYFSASAFMIAFGLGTVPLMMGVSLLGAMINLKWKSYLNKATPILAFTIALLLIIRGLNIEIPYVSPADSCCHVAHTH